MRRSTVSTASQTCSHGAASPCPVTIRRIRLDTARRLQFLIYLSLAAGFSAASAFAQATADESAQLAPTRKAPRGEALEKYDNPPAPPRKIQISPRMISVHGAFISQQVNVDASGNN